MYELIISSGHAGAFQSSQLPLATASVLKRTRFMRSGFKFARKLSEGNNHAINQSFRFLIEWNISLKLHANYLWLLRSTFCWTQYSSSVRYDGHFPLFCYFLLLGMWLVDARGGERSSIFNRRSHRKLSSRSGTLTAVHSRLCGIHHRNQWVTIHIPKLSPLRTSGQLKIRYVLDVTWTTEITVTSVTTYH